MLAALVGCLIAFGLFFILTFSILGSLIPSEPQIRISPSTILKIDLSQTIAEQTVESPIELGEMIPAGLPAAGATSSIGILNTIKAIDNAAEDPNISLIYLDKCEFAGATAYLEEMRNALERFRNSGKPVIAYAENLSLGGYYIASVADKIYLDEVATITMNGIASQLIFFKDLLDRLGVDVQLIRHGKYKSAGEQFVRDNISEDNRYQNQEMVNALWKAISEDICISKNIDIEVLDGLVSNLKLNTAEDMVKAGLADKIVSTSEMEDILCDLTGAKEVKKLKQISLPKYIKATIKPNYKAKEKIAIVYADGQINQIGSDGITAAKYLPILKDIKNDTLIKALVLRVNSPGGSVQPAEQIRKELELIGETRPVIVSYGTVAASGGYWISAGADKIFTNKTTLTGSIGVFSMIPSFEKTVKNIAHVNPVTIKSHEHADMMTLMRKLDKTEVEAMQAQVELIYNKFLNVVSEGRDLSVRDVDNIAQGRVWCGNEAIGIKLVDEIGGIKEALEYAVTAANLTNYKLVEYPSVKSPIQKAMESLKTPEARIEEIYSKIQAGNGIFARLPYIYSFE